MATTTLTITNPATGALIAARRRRRPRDVAAQYERRAPRSPRWAATPMRRRIARDREVPRARRRADRSARADADAGGRQADPPVAQRAQRTARPPRFLPRRIGARAAREKVFADRRKSSRSGSRTSRSASSPTSRRGTIRTSSAATCSCRRSLAGNAVLYKPSEFATLTGRHIADLLHAAGVPRRRVRAGHRRRRDGRGAAAPARRRRVLHRLVRHRRKIAAAAGERMIKVQLELGGKDPIYVCDDVDVKAAAAAVADGAFYNTGQSCCSVERIYVHESIHDAFVDAFVAEVEVYRIGDPMDEATYIGAITRAPQLDVLREAGGRREAEGRACCCSAASAIKRKGNWFAPTVLDRRRPFDARDARRELRPDHRHPGGRRRRRGRRADERHRVRAHRRRVHRATSARARRSWRSVNAGSVYWNCCDRVSPRLPWSGVKHSGIGLTLSTYGIQTFTRPKAWHLKS